MKTLLFIIAFSIFFSAFSLTAQPVHTAVKDVTMAAPNAAALGKYGDIPVSYFTGVPNVNIPIYTIQDGPLSLPVSLSYHASGIKVGETASWVGLGWSLNAGGMITRTTLGLPDEAGGYMTTGKNLKYPITASYPAVYPTNYPWNGINQSDIPLINQQMEDVAEGTMDAEPDLFSFNFAGYSGKFFYDKDTTIYIIPKSDLKIKFAISGGDIYQFIITTSDGTRYIFGTLEGESASSHSGVEFSYYSNIPTNAIAPTSWYLRRVESADKQYHITLTYASENYAYKNLSSCTVNWGSTGQISQSCGPIPVGTNTGVMNNDMQGKRLSQITNSSGTTQIDFIANTLREDLDSYLSTTAKRLDAIEIKAPGNLAYCKKFNFSYDYMLSSGGTASHYKRLRLLQLQETSCDGTITIPAHKFTYNSGTLPHRFSKQIDHWGYFNGVLGNEGKIGIPTGTSIAWLGQIFSPPFANSDRESSESNMLIGALQKIEYPTGGNTQFIYEANDSYQSSVIPGITTIMGSISNCTYPQAACCTTEQGSGTKTFTADELNGAQLRLTLYNLNIAPYQYCNIGNTSPPSPSVQVIAKVTGNTVGIGSYSFNINNSQSTVEMVKPLTQLGNFQPGVSYTFTVYVSHGKGEFSIFKNTTTSVSSNKKVGGLRVKEIKSHDGVSTANDVVKRYKYTNTGSSNSSGVLFQKPEYAGYQEAWEGSRLGVTFNAGAVVPLSSANGYHIAYNRVEEEHVGNGKSVFNFYYEFNTQQTQQTYPAVPEQARVKDGHLNASEISNLSGTVLSSSQTTLYNDNYIYTPGIMYRCYKVSIWDVSAQRYEYTYYAKPFSLRTAAVRTLQEQSTIDGVTTVSSYEYDSLGRHLAPTGVVLTNSDGKIYRTRYKYVFDWTDSGLTSIRDNLISRNMIGMPVETTVRIGSDTLSGSKTEYSFFNSSGLPTTTVTGSFPYPYRFYNFERTWTNGALQGGNWALQGTINSYHPNSSVDAKGYPKQFTKINWQPETYEWKNGLITKRTFQNFVWQYRYYNGTRLLSGITHIDGQRDSFMYDKLSRLSKTWSRGGNVVTNYTYAYKGGSVPWNYVKAVTDFTPVTSSNLTQKGSVQHFDGLGRLIQESKIKHHPTVGANGQLYGMVDVLTQYQYDNQGRMMKSSLPYPSPSNSTDGSYQTPPVGLLYTTTAYEASPLNRATSVTPPNWYATMTAYGKNTSTITAPNGTEYSAGTLYETKVTDPDTRVVFTYKDKKGRVILTMQTDTAGTNPARTYNLYDDKDRLTTVVPPGATLSTPELIYKYEYSGDDLLLKKKVPGAAEVQMKYNNRDLLTFTQDGNLAALTKSLGIQYDIYGRPIATGFMNGFTTDPNSVFSLNEVLTENFYDGAGGGITSNIDPNTSPQYRGKIRCSKTKILGTSTSLNTTFTYDTHGRVTNTTGNNYLNTGSNTAEASAFTYDWADNRLTENRTHAPGSGAATGTQSVNYQWKYDHMGRLKDYLLELNSSITHLAEYNYNNRDEMVERNIGSTYIGGTYAWLQSVDYTYNDLGWLTKINSNSHTGTPLAFPTGTCTPGMPSPGITTRTLYPETNDLFYLELRYDQLFENTTAGGNISGISGTAQKAGNISQLAWRVRGRDRQAYNFTYDHLSRLSSATYFDVNNSNTATNTNRYNESLTYDLRGNITTLQRHGYYSSSCGYGQIDNLTYNYTANTNRIATIADNAPASQKMHGFNLGAGGVGYTYDANGNLKSDSYKGISNISYNHLNLPSVITYTSGNSIEFIYDAAGMKLRKIVKVGATVQYEQSYLGGLEYRKNGTGSTRIEAVYHNEGRYLNLNAEVNNTLLWQKEYTLKDHLGNARLSFTDKNANGIVDIPSDIVQENHYYPFGLNYEGGWRMNDVVARDSRYLYNNKELSDDFGLNLYAYGARYYDAAIGRFTGVDPIADQFAWVSPFNYAENYPTGAIDLHGLQKLVTTVYQVQREIQKDGAYSFKATQLGPTGITEPKGADWSGYKQNNVLFYEGKQVSSLNEIEGYKEWRDAQSVETVRTIGEVTETTGDIAKVGGLIISPFAPEIGIPVAEVGEAVSKAGTAIQVAADIKEEKYLDAAKRIAIDAAAGKVSKVAENAINKSGIDQAASAASKGTEAFLKSKSELVIEAAKAGTKEAVINDKKQKQ